eukprot:TRINITY_DN12830_c0_g1_i2.p1 TRINITY_DN12830_c0_g1~~TRINITY_DN12830_c0_g1_i2.p1  ORF type:complete len:202 (-),score=15.27 TRINITY_DN12830_c0_g1_i2:26-631(-)
MSHKRTTDLKSDIAGKKSKTSLFPLDRHRLYQGSYIDQQGYTHKKFQLTSNSDPNDKIEIEYVVKDNLQFPTHATPFTLFPMESDKYFVSEFVDESGYTHRIYLNKSSTLQDKFEVEYDLWEVMFSISVLRFFFFLVLGTFIIQISNIMQRTLFLSVKRLTRMDLFTRYSHIKLRNLIIFIFSEIQNRIDAKKQFGGHPKK